MDDDVDQIITWKECNQFFKRTNFACFTFQVGLKFIQLITSIILICTVQWWGCDALLLQTLFNNLIGTYQNRSYRKAPYGKDWLGGGERIAAEALP